MTRTATPLAAASILAVGLTGIAPAALGDQFDASVVRVTVPELRTTSASVSVATAPGGSRMTADGGTTVQVAPSSITLSPKPPLDPAGLSALVAQGRVGAEVRWGRTDCTTPRWIVPSGGFTGKDRSAAPAPTGGTGASETLTPGASGRLCVRLTSPLRPDELQQRFAGRTVALRTTWRSTTPAPLSWTATASTNALHTLPLDPPVAPSQACTVADNGKDTPAATIRWAWPSASAKPVPGAEGIARWSVVARLAGTDGPWKQVAQIAGKGSARAQAVTAKNLAAAGLPDGNHDVLVRAYPFAGNADVWTDSASVWQVTLAKGEVTCRPTRKNDQPPLHTGSER